MAKTGSEKLLRQLEFEIITKNTKSSLKETNDKTSWYTYMCVFIVNLPLLNIGTSMVWTSPIIPKLKSNDTEINPLGSPITTVQISLIASLTYFMAMMTFILQAKLSDRTGRKRYLRYSACCLVATLVGAAFAKNIYIYYVCLIGNGFGNAGVYINVPIYNNEIAKDCNRGRIGCFVGATIPLGMLFAYILGPITSVKTFFLLYALPPALFLILYPLVPESPIYFTSMGKKDEAIKSLDKLRRPRNPADIQLEYQHIEKSVNIMEQKIRFLEIFRSRTLRRGLALSLLVNIAEQMSGVTVILSYMAPIFNEAGSSLSGDEVGVLVGSVKLFFYLTTICFVDKLGRKTLLLISSVTTTIAMFFLGLCFYFKSINSPIIQELRWFPVLCGIVFIIGYGLGLGPLPIAMVSEFFPTEYRATGVGIVYTIDSLCIFLVVFTFPLAAEAYGIYFSMFLYSAFNLIMFILMFLYIPETKGKSLKEIQEILAK